MCTIPHIINYKVLIHREANPIRVGAISIGVVTTLLGRSAPAAGNLKMRAWGGFPPGRNLRF